MGLGENHRGRRHQGGQRHLPPPLLLMMVASMRPLAVRRRSHKGHNVVAVHALAHERRAVHQSTLHGERPVLVPSTCSKGRQLPWSISFTVYVDQTLLDRLSATVILELNAAEARHGRGLSVPLVSKPRKESLRRGVSTKVPESLVHQRLSCRILPERALHDDVVIFVIRHWRRSCDARAAAACMRRAATFVRDECRAQHRRN